MYEKQMELFEDGGLKDEGGMVDEESGNEVPVGSTRKEVRDDIPAMLSEGEFVFPADVVRYIGLENLMRIRQEAKMGLKQMEAMGQMGNADEAVLPDDMPFGMMDLIIVEGPEEEDEDEMEERARGGVLYANQGTFVTPMFDPSNQDVREYKNEAGDSLFIPFLGGEPVYPIPTGYFPAGEVPTETEAETTPVATDDDGGTPVPTPESYDWDTDTSATDGAALQKWIDEADKASTFGNVAAGVGMAINPLLGGAIALANKQQKKKIVEMLDQKIAQARRTPVEGQVAALQDIKDRLTNPERKTILGKVVSSVIDPIKDALGLTEEETKKAKVGSVVSSQQAPDEPDEKTDADVTAVIENPDAKVTELVDAGVIEETDVAPVSPVAPVAPETPEAIPTEPEVPTLQTPDKMPAGMGIQGFEPSTTATMPDEGATPDTLPLRTEQQVVGAGMTVLQTALDEIRESQPYRGPLTGMTLEEKLADPTAPFRKLSEAISNAVGDKEPKGAVPRTDRTPPTTQPRSDDGGGRSARETQEINKMRQEQAKQRAANREAAQQGAKDIAAEAKATGKSIAEVGRAKAPSSESKSAAEKAKEEGDPRNMKSGGLASRKKKK
jgi:hypothetical protein